ncbi:MAG: hypothetical protein BWK80_49805 [Desulfobacteraceae bacterium IS3]|nr:MAG: hypothetical protein BWK80_49805 [Desulfobacteraceae bacterium IS3]
MAIQSSTISDSFESQKAMLESIAPTMNRGQLSSLITHFAEKIGVEKFKAKAAEEILSITKPSDVVPNIYRDYRQIVHDGIGFLLSGFSLSRLSDIVADQFQMGKNAGVEDRLIKLAGQIPTLHKLGQIIARNRNVEPGFKKWLIRLENGFHGTDIHLIHQKIKAEIGELIKTFSIKIENHIMAEASVGTVVGFTWQKPDTGKQAKGVFKLLRPRIKERLAEELLLLEKLADFFEKNRHSYTLANFRFVETFREIRNALQKEMNLEGEQSNLRRALFFYKKEKAAQIPRVLPNFSTENMTAMEFMEGRKITETPRLSGDRKDYARLLFHTLVAQPLFSREKETVFHGDPHAGNIFARRDEKENDLKLILLDWSQTGALSKEQRLNITRLALGILIENESQICDAVEALSETPPQVKTEGGKESIPRIVREIADSQEYLSAQLTKKLFVMIDQAVIKGIQFPGELLLFRKAFFTLEGVIYDLDPEFDMDACIVRVLSGFVLEETPKRWLYAMLLNSDLPEYYSSHLSNKDLHQIGTHFFMEGMRKGSELLNKTSEKYFEFLTFPAEAETASRKSER